MVKRVFLDGRLHTFLVTEGEGEDDFGNPVFDTLQAQAERIEFLEKQNEVLLHQERTLMHLLELAGETHRALCNKMAELKEILRTGLSAAEGESLSQDS